MMTPVGSAGARVINVDDPFGLQLARRHGQGAGQGSDAAQLFLAVPTWIAEVMMCLHEVVNGEVVFAIVEAGAASNDLFELNDAVHGAHEDDIADIARVDSR